MLVTGDSLDQLQLESHLSLTFIYSDGNSLPDPRVRNSLGPMKNEHISAQSNPPIAKQFVEANADADRAWWTRHVFYRMGVRTQFSFP